MKTKDSASKPSLNDLPDNNGKEILEQVPPHYTNNTKSNITQFSTAEIPCHLVYGVSYGPGGIKGRTSNPFVFGAAFLTSLRWFSFGYDQGVVSVIKEVERRNTRSCEAELQALY